jgi:hypothetical protein
MKRTLSNKKRYLFIIIFLIISSIPCFARSDNIVVLTDEQEKYDIGLSLEYLEDSSGSLDIDDVTSPEFREQFVPSRKKVLNIGLTASAFWVRFRVRNESVLTTSWLLEHGFANMHHVDFYRPLPDGYGFKAIKTGIFRPGENREVDHHRFVFKLSLPPGSEEIT